MPKALTIQRSTVPSTERANYTKRLKVLRSHFSAANCRFWVFEESSLPGAFIEFTEADDQETLTVAHANAPHKALDPTRVYREVEL
ncbi:MAG: hypothetical protein M3Z18_10390 [Gemmatimonadota bacterium]|nr:hypothetical protein [Gemmatimonadota bacterium]